VLGEELRRRLRLSGINASVISKGASGFEVVVPKDELEKLTPEEKEAIKQYLEHVAQTRDEEKKKEAEEVLRRFDFGAKAFNIGGIRLKLAHDRGKIKAEKYGDPQLIAEIKTVLERKLREMLGNEYEQWRDHIKIAEGGKRLIITQQTTPKTHAKPQHRQKRKNLKTHKNKDTAREPLHRLRIKHSGAKPRVGLVAYLRDSGRSRVRIPAGAYRQFYPRSVRSRFSRRVYISFSPVFNQVSLERSMSLPYFNNDTMFQVIMPIMMCLQIFPPIMLPSHVHLAPYSPMEV
jgi:hypothetical protein